MSGSGAPTIALVGTLIFSGAALAADPVKVVTSIKPIHSLVAGVMRGVAEPALLVKGAASPHSFNLRPSDARALNQADVIGVGQNATADAQPSGG